MFSERLKSERKAKKWTQQQLADKLHIARSNVSNWEANNNGISTELLQSLADLFGCSTDYLLGKTDKRTTYEQWDEKFPINKQRVSRHVHINTSFMLQSNNSSRLSINNQFHRANHMEIQSNHPKKYLFLLAQF